ncbi:ribonuclease H-like domain-containing protein [Tanacetum coccineum]
MAQPVGSSHVHSAQQAHTGSTHVFLGSIGPTATPGQATTLSHAFTIGTLHDLAIRAWNMDTGGDVLHRLVSNNVISYNKEKHPVLCHACQLGKHVRLPFDNSNTVVTSCFDIIHSDVWTSPIPSHSGFKYYVLFLDHYSQFVWVYPLLNKSNVLSKFVLSRSYVRTQFKCKIHSFQCNHGGEFDNRNLHKVFAENGIQFQFLCPKTSQQNADGTLSRYKAHFVAHGSTQLEGVDVDESFSLVVKPGTIQTVLSLVASRHWLIHQLDVKNAFLHGDLSETVYMHQPPSVLRSISRVLVFSIVASSQALLQQIITSLHKEFAMTDLRSLNYFLGISVTRDSSGMFLSQKKYAIEILETPHMVNCNPSRTPIDTESKLGSDGDPVCLYMHDPWEPYFLALKRILRSVRGTLDHGLQLFSPLTTDLVAYSDADWVSCHTTRRLTSGYCVFLGNNLLSWSSKRQLALSRSSAEVEYCGVANAVVETCWLRNLLRELHTPLSSATLVYCDNFSVVYLSCNPVQHQRTKHIEIVIHFVHDLVAACQVRVLHVPSRYQYADIFTKGLPSALFEEFRSSLSVRSPTAPTTGEC